MRTKFPTCFVYTSDDHRFVMQTNGQAYWIRPFGQINPIGLEAINSRTKWNFIQIFTMNHMIINLNCTYCYYFNQDSDDDEIHCAVNPGWPKNRAIECKDFYWAIPFLS